MRTSATIYVASEAFMGIKMDDEDVTASSSPEISRNEYLNKYRRNVRRKLNDGSFVVSSSSYHWFRLQYYIALTLNWRQTSTNYIL